MAEFKVLFNFNGKEEKEAFAEGSQVDLTVKRAEEINEKAQELLKRPALLRIDKK